jgi:hypothetical protein
MRDRGMLRYGYDCKIAERLDSVIIMHASAQLGIPLSLTGKVPRQSESSPTTSQGETLDPGVIFQGRAGQAIAEA